MQLEKSNIKLVTKQQQFQYMNYDKGHFCMISRGKWDTWLFIFFFLTCYETLCTCVNAELTSHLDQCQKITIWFVQLKIFYHPVWLFQAWRYPKVQREFVWIDGVKGQKIEKEKEFRSALCHCCSNYCELCPLIQLHYPPQLIP